MEEIIFIKYLFLFILFVSRNHIHMPAGQDNKMQTSIEIVE